MPTSMYDHSLYLPGSHQSLMPWAQSGMSLAVVLVALTVLLLSCCGAAALILAACCSSRRRDAVAESSDSRWLPGVGVIDYVPVSNRSSVRVSLVLSEGSQDLDPPLGSGTPDDALWSLSIVSHRPPSPPSPVVSERSTWSLGEATTSSTLTSNTPSTSTSASSTPTEDTGFSNLTPISPSKSICFLLPATNPPICDGVPPYTTSASPVGSVYPTNINTEEVSQLSVFSLSQRHLPGPGGPASMSNAEAQDQYHSLSPSHQQPMSLATSPCSHSLAYMSLSPTSNIPQVSASRSYMSSLKLSPRASISPRSHSSKSSLSKLPKSSLSLALPIASLELTTPSSRNAPKSPTFVPLSSRNAPKSPTFALPFSRNAPKSPTLAPPSSRNAPESTTLMPLSPSSPTDLAPSSSLSTPVLATTPEPSKYFKPTLNNSQTSSSKKGFWSQSPLLHRGKSSKGYNS